jgi:hypothetical protein
VVWFLSQSGGLRTRGTVVWEQHGVDVWQSQSKFSLPWSFCSVWVPTRLGDVHLQAKDGSSILSLPIQMLIPSRNTFQAHPEWNVLLVIWASLSSDNWT